MLDNTFYRVFIGVYPSTTDYLWRGLIDYAIVYTHALTSSEVEEVVYSRTISTDPLLFMDPTYGIVNLSSTQPTSIASRNVSVVEDGRKWVWGMVTSNPTPRLLSPPGKTTRVYEWCNRLVYESSGNEWLSLRDGVYYCVEVE